MQALVSGEGLYPRNMSVISQKLNDYARQTNRISSLNQVQSYNNGMVEFYMPNSVLVDFDTVNLFFNLITNSTGGYAAPPKNIELLIDKIYCDINGTPLNQANPYMNHLYNIHYDTQCGIQGQSRRNISQNAANQPIPIAYTNGIQYCINNFTGPIGSISPRVQDMSLLGAWRTRIQLAGPQVLLQSATSTAATFTLTNIFITVDTLNIDENFYKIRNDFLKRGNTLQMNYYNYCSFTNAFTNSFSGNTKFLLSTQSLNRVWSVFTPLQATVISSVGNAAPSTTGCYFDPGTSNSSYFQRVCGGSTSNSGPITYGFGSNTTSGQYNLQNYQWNINGTVYPMLLPTPEQTFGLLTSSYGLAYDMQSGINPDINSLNSFLNSYYVIDLRLDHGSELGTTLISGVNTLGVSGNNYLVTNGNAWTNTVLNAGAGALVPNNMTCIVFTQSTSTLNVSDGRNLYVTN